MTLKESEMPCISFLAVNISTFPDGTNDVSILKSCSQVILRGTAY